MPQLGPIRCWRCCYFGALQWMLETNRILAPTTAHSTGTGRPLLYIHGAVLHVVLTSIVNQRTSIQQHHQSELALPGRSCRPSRRAWTSNRDCADGVLCHSCSCMNNCLARWTPPRNHPSYQSLPPSRSNVIILQIRHRQSLSQSRSQSRSLQRSKPDEIHIATGKKEAMANTAAGTTRTSLTITTAIIMTAHKPAVPVQRGALPSQPGARKRTPFTSSTREATT